MSTPQAISYYSCEMNPEKPVKQDILLSGFYIRTAPAFNIADGHSRSKEVHCELLSNMTN